MSINTSARINPDALQAALPAGAAFTTAGGDLPSAQPKTITFYGTDDTTGQAALTTAAGQFVDRDANQSTLRAQAQTALANNRTYLAIASPTTAQVAAQVKALTNQTQALIRMALNQFDATN